jgi:hypothetical protein
MFIALRWNKQNKDNVYISVFVKYFLLLRYVATVSILLSHFLAIPHKDVAESLSNQKLSILKNHKTN